MYDTESTDLSASWGRVLCCSFVGLEGDAYTFRADRAPHKGKTKIDDSKLVVAIRDELEPDPAADEQLDELRVHRGALKTAGQPRRRDALPRPALLQATRN